MNFNHGFRPIIAGTAAAWEVATLQQLLFPNPKSGGDWGSELTTI
jgi:hypothetical protein